jgi:hypothetical protein
MRLGLDLILIIFYFRKLKDDNVENLGEFIEIYG